MLLAGCGGNGGGTGGGTGGTGGGGSGGGSGGVNDPNGGCDPAKDYYTSGTYYNSVTNAMSGDALLKSLSTTINAGAKQLSYAAVYDSYNQTDINPKTGKIWDMYSNYNYTYKTNACGKYTNEGDCYNREHSIPKSWFNEKSPMYTDLQHLYPTDGKVNGMRSNYAFGEVKTASYTSENGSKLGSSSFAGYSGTVFEPIDEYKGDFARTYFYFATRYYSQLGTWTDDGKVMFQGGFPYLTSYALNLMLKWSKQDPVSAKETARNDAVYKIQNNRNPFIDHESYIYRIWDSSYLKAGKTDAELASEIKALINAIGTVTTDSKAAIEAARKAYDSATAAVKALVTNYSVLTDAEVAYDNLVKNADANIIIGKINEIGTVSLDSESKIAAARDAYNTASAAVKALVTNYEILTTAETRYQELKDIDAALKIDAEIEDIGNVTLDSKSLIDTARNAYNAGSAKAKTLVTKYTVLTDAETEYARLKHNADVNVVVNAIAAIGEVTLESNEKITTARTAYNNATAEVKADVTNYSVLTDAETSYTQLVNAKKIFDVESLIGLIDNPVTLTSKTQINNAKVAFDALDETLQSQVSNAEVLTSAITEYTSLSNAKEAQDIVDLIDSLGEIKLTSKDDIDFVREAYDDASDEVKALITAEQLKVLTDAEAEYAVLVEKDNANKVVVLFDAIGEVSREKKTQINAARAAYEALTENEKAFITAEQLKVLTDAETELQKQIDELGELVGETVLCSFTNNAFKNASNYSFVANPVPGNSYENGRGVAFKASQIIGSSSPVVTITSSSYTQSIQSITIDASKNKSNSFTIDVSVGGIAMKPYVFSGASLSHNMIKLEFEDGSTYKGEVVIKLSSTETTSTVTGSFWINSIQFN